MRAVVASAAVTLALALAAAGASGTGAANERCGRTLVNRVHGFRLSVPCGWRGRVRREDGQTLVASRSVSVELLAYGRGPWAARLRPRPRRPEYGPLGSWEGIGPAYGFHFTLRGRAFQAFVRVTSRATARARSDALRVLESVALTPRAFRIASEQSVRVIGSSVERRPLRAWRIGNPRGPRRVLLVGCLRGAACGGMRVAQQLLGPIPPLEHDLWLVQTMNPDGLVRHARRNARGVDLSAAFRRPSLAPEVRAVRSLIRRIRPDVTIWWDDGPRAVVRASGPAIGEAVAFARAARLPVGRPRPATSGPAAWTGRTGRASFTVETRSPLPLAAARRYARAVLAVTER